MSILKTKKRTSGAVSGGRDRRTPRALRAAARRPASRIGRSLLLESLEPRVLLAMDTFAAGSLIIDMGQSTQTIGNALKPYGLVYDLVTNYKVPVNWAINPAKTTFRLNPGDPIPFDFTATITTGTKSYAGGSFIIDEALLTPAVLSAVNGWKAQGVVVDQLAAPLTTEIHGQITSFPKAVLDSQNGALAQPYYANAGVPASSYRLGGPADLVQCDDVYIMPHADPQNWTATEQTQLYTFVDNGGGLWAGCHAVSALENVVTTIAGVPTQLNFLSNDLVLWGDHGAGTLPYSYNPAAANDPIMQIMNRLDSATTNGSEQIYVPTTLDWRSTTTVAVSDPDHPDNPPDGTAPFNDAAVVAYGRAYGDPTNGLVMYEGGHSLAKATLPANIAAQRAFFNFLLTEGLDKAPQLTVTPSYVVGGTSTITATISGGTGVYTYQWVSSSGGVFSNPAGTWMVGDPPITTQYHTTSANDTIRLLVTDVPCGRKSIWYDTLIDAPPTIDLDGNNSTGATGADYKGYFQGSGVIVPAADVDVAVTDDSTTIHSAAIKLTTRPDGTAETLLIDEALAASFGISVASDGMGGFILTGAATLDQYEAVIATLEYVNSSTFPTTTDRVITVSVNDGINNSNTAVSRLTYAGGSPVTVDKQLYLSDPGQGMDRIDPVATADGTTSSVPVVPVVSPNSTGLAAWSNNANKNLEYRPWNLTTYGAQSTTAADGGSYNTMASASSPLRNEIIQVGVTSDRHVSGSIWNGSSWIPIQINIGGTTKANLGAPSAKEYWGAGVAYETNSGRAMLVWNTGSTLNYSLWNGLSWTPAASIPAYTGTEPRQIRLASNPLAGSNEITMVVTSKNEVDYALVWNGTSWGNAIQLDNNTGHNFTDASVAYEQLTGRAMVTYASGTAGAVGYNLWNGTSWSAAATIAAPAGSNNYAQWTVLASDPNSNRIVLGVESNGKDAWMNVWNGSAWGTAQLGIQDGVNDNNNLGIAVAFESQSGEALAIYQRDLNATELQYRTWSSGSGWSAGTDFGAFGNHETRAITLSSNPYSDQIQLMVNDDDKDLRSALWSGSAFAAPILLESDTNTTTGQPFVFNWDEYLVGTVTTTTTFTQTSPMVAPFVLPSGGDVTATAYIQLTSGVLPATPNLAVRLGHSGSPFLTISTPPTVTSLGGGIYKLQWTGTMPSTTTVPTGGQISLTLIDFDSTYAFNILYDSSTYPSQVELATATGITIDSAAVFGAAFPGGSPIVTGEAGQPVYVRFTVSDPFGAADITSADLVIKNSLGATVASATLTNANVVASTPGSKTYEYAWTPTTPDSFTIDITAHEGTEGVTATAQRPFVATARPDLVVSKTDFGTSATPGGSVSYVINYSNVGLVEATGVFITEFLPAGTTFNAIGSSPGWFQVGSGEFRFPVGTVAAGASGSVLLSILVPNPVGPTEEILLNRVAITDDGTHGPDLNPNNNIGDDTTPVLAAPDLVVTKTDGGVSTLPGGIVLYQISYANTGNQDAIGVAIQETLPANTTFNSTYSVGDWDDVGGGAFSLLIGDLPAGASGTAFFAVQVNSPLPGGVTEILNTVLIADGGSGGPDPTPGNNTSTDTTPIANNPQADLQITKTNNLTSVTPGQVVTYAITVSNAGPNAVTGASFSDVVPADLAGVTFSTMVTGGAAVTPATGSGNNINGSLNLPVGATVTYTVTGTLDPHALGTLTNIATVFPPSGTLDPNTGNNAAVDEDPIVPESDLSLTKTYTYTDADNSGTLTPGDQIVFTLTLTNAGPNDAQAVSVLVKDQLPTGYVYVSDDASINGGSYSPGSGLWTLSSVGVLPPSNTAVLHITALVNAGGDYTNVAEVWSSGSHDPDSTPGNEAPGEDDRAVVTPPVEPVSDLSLGKTMALTSDLDGNGILSIGDRVTFTLTIGNAGPNAATNVHVADLLPAGYTYFSSLASQGMYTSGTGGWNLGTLNVLATATLQIVATVVGNQPISAYTNYAQVSASGNFDPDSTPGDNSTNQDDDALFTPQIADLSLTKTVAFAPGGDLDANGTPSFGDQIVFTVTVSNAGPDFATGVQVKDQLPTGYIYDDDDGAGAYDPLTGVWLVGALAPGAVRTLHITATINSTGIYANTAQVSASEHFDPDSTPNNNVGTEDDQATATLVPGAPAQPPVAVNDSSLHNPPGPVTLNVTGNDSDPNLDLAVGTVDLDPTTAGQQTSRTVPGQGTWTVDGLGNVTFTPIPGFTQDPTPINYTVQDAGGRTSNQATITIDYVPVASNDSSSGHATGTAVTVPVLANDTTGDSTVPSTVQIVGTPGPGVSLVVPGEGTWSINTSTGAITFTPEPGFTGDPTPIQYTVKDNDGNTSNPALVTIDYVQSPPVAANDHSPSNPPGSVTINVIGNDTDPNNDIDPSTVDLDPSTPGQDTTLVVPGEGVWTVDDFGNVTFTPQVGFEGEPTPIPYTVEDATGLVSNPATISIDYLPAIQVVKSSNRPTVPETGGIVTYTYLVTNTGAAASDDPLSGVVLADIPNGTPVFQSGDDGDNLLEAGEVWTYTLTVTLPAADAGASHVNTVTATATDDEGNPASDTDSVTVGYTNSPPAITVVKSANPTSVPEVGGTVTYTYLVTNTSLAAAFDPLSSVSLSDTDGTPIFQTGDDGDGLLELGETWTYTLTIVVPPGNAGSTHVNTVTATGTDDEGSIATGTDIESIGYTNSNPSIVVDKVGPVSIVHGQTATYTFTITNTSPAITDPVTITAVVDDQLGNVYPQALAAYQATHPGATTIVLQKGESLTFSVTSPVLNSTVVVNIVNVTGQDNEGTGATANDTWTVIVNYPPVAVNDSKLMQPPGPVTLPNITGNDSDPNGDLVVNSVDLNPGAAGRQTTLVVPGEGTWTVDNLGNVTFTPAPGFTHDPTPISYTISDATGLVSNQALLTIDYVPVASNDSSTNNPIGTAVTVPVLINDTTGDVGVPSTVQIVGTANPGDPLVVPGQGTWTVNTSTGAITFTPAPGFTGDPTPIQYTIQDNDGNTSAPATVTVTYVQTADLSLSKSAALTTDADGSGNISAGDTLTFTISVSNAGPAVATGVGVKDNLPAGYTYVAGSANFGGVFSGGMVNWTGLTVPVGVNVVTLTYRVTVVGGLDASTGSYTNYAQISASNLPDPDSTPGDNSHGADDDAAVTPPIPIIELAKAGIWNDADQDRRAEAGETINYLVTVHNKGSVPLHNVVVTDTVVSLVRSVDLVGDNDTLLEPGEVWQYAATYVLTQADINSGAKVNTASVTAMDPGNNTLTSADTASVPLPYIINDFDSAATFVGSNWKSSLLKTGYFNNDLHWLQPGLGNNYADFNFMNLAPGCYQVATTWYALDAAGRATNAPYTVFGSNGEPPVTVLVDQSVNLANDPTAFQDQGVYWKTILNMYTVTGTNLTVRIADNANGWVVADAVRIVSCGAAPPPSPAPMTAVSDDGDPSFSAPGFLTATGQGYQNDVRYSPANAGKTATWTFTGLDMGAYRVSTTWSPYSNRATNAPYTINGGAAIPVNQRLAPVGFTSGGATWQDLGNVTVTGGSLTVRLTDVGANGYVIADGVRIERLMPVTGPEIELTESGVNLLDGNAVVNFGTTPAGAPVVKTFTVTNPGTALLNLGPLSLPAGFSQVGSVPASVAPSGTAIFQVRYDATTSPGVPVSGQLSLANNDADENPFNFTLTGMVANPVTIMDNGDAGFAAPGFTPFGGQGYQNDVHYSAANAGRTATWSFTGLAAGIYRVSATWYAYSNRATNAPYTINGGPVIAVNQRVPPAGFTSGGATWQDLANVTISGTTLTVALTDVGANGYVIADAIRVERLGPLHVTAPDGAAPPPNVGAGAALSAQTLTGAAQRLLPQAIDVWAAIDGSAAQRLTGAAIHVADLPDAILGLGSYTTPDLWLDADAAGYGWQIGRVASQSTRGAGGRIDLFTVLLHELGHLLGYADQDSQDDSLMSATLMAGRDRLPLAESRFGGADSDEVASRELFAISSRDSFASTGADRTSVRDRFFAKEPFDTLSRLSFEQPLGASKRAPGAARIVSRGESRRAAALAEQEQDLLDLLSSDRLKDAPSDRSVKVRK